MIACTCKHLNACTVYKHFNANIVQHCLIQY